MSAKLQTLVGTLPSCLVAEGLHEACLVTVRRFENAHGPRIGFEFVLMGGEQLLTSAAPSTNPRSKLAELLRGFLGRDPVGEELDDPMRLAGVWCKVLVRTETNKSGRAYSNVVTAFR